MGTIVLPAERWEEVASAYSAHLAVEHKGRAPIAVLSSKHGGHLYTIFCVMRGPWGAEGKPCAEGYKLVPLSMYAGETTAAYHDKRASDAGARQTGDLAGLIVSVRGEMVVCAEPAKFVMDLPGTRPLSLSEAEAYDERQRRAGWRSLFYGGKTPEWFSLKGHPVAVYRGHRIFDGETCAVLFWRHDAAVRELLIANDVPLEARSATLAPDPAPAAGQLALF